MEFSEINCIFLGVAKCASEGIHATLIKSLGKDRCHNHDTWQDVLRRHNDVENQRVFMVVREPVQRFYSALTYLQYQPQWSGLTIANVLKICHNRNNLQTAEDLAGLDVVFHPQSKWCAGPSGNKETTVEIVPFESLPEFWKRFQAETKAGYGIEICDLLLQNSTPAERKLQVARPTREEAEEIRKIYADDVKLYNDAVRKFSEK